MYLDISGFDNSKKAMFVDLWLKNNDGHLANEINPFVKMKNCLKRLHQQEKQKLSKFHVENQNFRLLQVFEDISTFIFNASIIIHEWFTTCGENCSKINGNENFNNFNGTFSSVSEIIDHGNSSFISISLSHLISIINVSLFAADTYAYMPYIWKNTTTLPSQPWGNRFITTPLMIATVGPKLINVALFIGLFIGNGWICFGMIFAMIMIYLAMFFMVTKLHYKNFDNLETETYDKYQPFDSESSRGDLGDNEMDAEGNITTEDKPGKLLPHSSGIYVAF